MESPENAAAAGLPLRHRTHDGAAERHCLGCEWRAELAAHLGFIFFLYIEEGLLDCAAAAACRVSILAIVLRTIQATDAGID